MITLSVNEEEPDKSAVFAIFIILKYVQKNFFIKKTIFRI